MTSDEQKALQAKLTEMVQRYNVQQISAYVASRDLLFGQHSQAVGAYALDKNGEMICLEDKSFEGALQALEHKLIALRMGEGACNAIL